MPTIAHLQARKSKTYRLYQTWIPTSRQAHIVTPEIDILARYP